MLVLSNVSLRPYVMILILEQAQTLRMNTPQFKALVKLFKLNTASSNSNAENSVENNKCDDYCIKVI